MTSLRRTVSLVFLLFISGVVAEDGWTVNYNPTSICALKGAAVTMHSTYTHPSGHSVLKAFWTKELVTSGSEPPDLLTDPEYKDRVHYLKKKKNTCTFRLKNVREKDQTKYYFTFITDRPGGRYQGAGGVDLKVTGLQVEVPERVIEGGKVTLTCKTTCNLTVTQNFTWYRDGHGLSSSTDQLLHLQPVSREHAGRYHCAAWGLNSPEVTLNIKYGPKSVSMSISPSGKIVEGRSVTLTCSSDADPPVDCTWFKGESLVAEGNTYTMEKVSSVDSGGYRCKCSNGYIEKYSEAVSLNVLSPPKNVSVSISPSGYIVEGSSVTLTCSSDANPPVNCTWFKGASLVVRGETYTLKKISSVDSGGYRCRCSNEHGEKDSEAVSLNVLYLRVEVPERVMEGNNVTLTCKTSFRLSDGPTFTWYRNGHPLSSSTDQLLHLQPVSREDAGRYHCAVLDQNLRSPEVTLNVSHGPKSVSVSISPSGEMVEGSSVTLTCSSDADPPVNCTWFKGTSLVVRGENYIVEKVSSVDSGVYRCRCSNGYIEKYSEAVSLNVLYPPKSVSVSIGPSGEIVEGSSVTLTCSSDANPPVQNYTWFKKLDKEALLKSTSQIYIISNISSADSGEYQCMANNTQGSQSSEYRTLTVLYAPKKPLVSISETAEGSSMTLTCSSDANPPVQKYTWFKEGGNSTAESGHIYHALQSGSYYCVAKNEYGSKESAAVNVTVKGVTVTDEGRGLQHIVLGGIAGAVAVILFASIAVLCIWRKRQGDTATCTAQGNLYNNLGTQLGARTSNATSGPNTSNQDDVHYASVVFRKANNPKNAESSAVTTSNLETDEEVQYASIQHHRDRVVEKTEGDDVQYASVRFIRPGATSRPAVSTHEDVSVIYSTLK